MLEMCRPFQHRLLLMLRDTFELAEDAVSENPIISKVCSEKILEFLLRHRILGL